MNEQMNSPAILPRPFSKEDGTRLLVTNKTSLQSGPSWECSNITTEKDCRKCLDKKQYVSANRRQIYLSSYRLGLLQTSTFLPAFFIRFTFLSESCEFLQ